MGLFSNLRGSAPAKAPSDATARAVLTLPLMVAGADGNIDRAELDQIINMCAFSPIFQAIGVDRMLALAKEIIADHRAKGAEVTFARVRTDLTPKLAETAMCFAIRTAMADGNVAKEEFDMLIAMAGRIGLPPETFKQIFDVMIMLQRRAA
jgi:tellurite resistance protein